MPSFEGLPQAPEIEGLTVETPVSEDPEGDEAAREIERNIEKTNETLEKFARLLDGLSDYVVFSSTAMYLHGQRLGKKDWAVPPGDFDAAFYDEGEWLRLGERLRNAPNVVLKKDGERAFPGQSVRVFAGTLDGYEFEIFLRTDRILSEEFFDRATRLHGLRVLNLEDVGRQYERNLEFDSRLWREVQKVASHLGPLFDGSTSDEERMAALGRIQMNEEEAWEAWALWNEHEAPGTDDARKERIQKELSALVGGVKTKVEQRLRNMEQIR